MRFGHRAMPSWLSAVLLTALLSGCSTIGDLVGGGSNTEPPTELGAFDATRNVSVLWDRDVGSGSGKRYLKLRPVFDDERVYVAESNGDVSAHDIASGENLWETDTDASVSGGPGTGDGLVLVGTLDGEVIALEATTGEERWRARVSSEVLSAPIAADGVTVVRTQDGKLFGLASDSGERRWVYDRTVPALTLRGTATPALYQGTVIAGFDSGRMVSLALDSGQLLWESTVAAARGRSELERLVDIDADPVVRDGTIYVVTYQGQVAALDAIGGEVAWRREMSSHAGLDVSSSALFVTDADSRVWALDRDTSASIWRQDGLAYRSLSQPAAIDDMVLVGDYEGYLHVLHQDDGRMLARIRVDSDGIAAQPRAVGELIAVYGRGGNLSLLRIE